MLQKSKHYLVWCTFVYLWVYIISYLIFRKCRSSHFCSRNRFTLLIANLSFDTQEREEKWKFDRFTAIRKFFELFNLNCLNHAVPPESLSLDEALYPTRNQRGIKLYNPNKPAKYGLLFKSLNGARYPTVFLCRKTRRWSFLYYRLHCYLYIHCQYKRVGKCDASFVDASLFW